MSKTTYVGGAVAVSGALPQSRMSKCLKHSICIVAALLQPISIADGGDITMTLTPTALTVTGKNVPKVTATIFNRKTRAVTLVLPADGSEVALRTPITGWSILPAYPIDASRRHPQDIPLQPPRGYEEVNPLERSQVFTLKPAQSKSFDVSLRPFNLPPGRYRAVFYYINDPSKKLAGYPLGKNEPGAEQLIAGSTRCKLVSNEIIVTIE